MIHTEKFRAMTPEEKQRYEAHRDLDRINAEIKEQRQRHQRQMDELEASAVRAGQEREKVRHISFLLTARTSFKYKSRDWEIGPDQ